MCRCLHSNVHTAACLAHRWLRNPSSLSCSCCCSCVCWHTRPEKAPQSLQCHGCCWQRSRGAVWEKKIGEMELGCELARRCCRTPAWFREQLIVGPNTSIGSGIEDHSSMKWRQGSNKWAVLCSHIFRKCYCLCYVLFVFYYLHVVAVSM